MKILTTERKSLCRSLALVFQSLPMRGIQPVLASLKTGSLLTALLISVVFSIGLWLLYNDINALVAKDQAIYFQINQIISTIHDQDPQSEASSQLLKLKDNLSPESSMRLAILRVIGLCIGLLFILMPLFWILFRLIPQTSSDVHTQNIKLFSDTNEAVVLLGTEGQIIESNLQFLEWIQTTENDIQSIDFFKPNPNFSFELLELHQPLEKMLNSARAFRTRAKLLIKTKVFIIDVSFYPEKHDQTKTRYLIVMRDITPHLKKDADLGSLFTQKSENQLLMKQSLSDPLTLCLNRLYLQEQFEAKNLRWLAFEGCSLLLIDINRFGEINKRRGSLLADKILKEFSQRMRGFFRKTDKVIRYHGDQFVVLLPKANMQMAQQIAQNFLDKCLSESFFGEKLEVAIGIAELSDQESGESWIQRADNALFKAKSNKSIPVVSSDLSQLEILS